MQLGLLVCSTETPQFRVDTDRSDVVILLKMPFPACAVAVDNTLFIDIIVLVVSESSMCFISTHASCTEGKERCICAAGWEAHMVLYACSFIQVAFKAELML